MQQQAPGIVRKAVEIGRCCTYSTRDQNILNKDNSLGLDNKEVDQFMDITNHGIQRVLGNREVFSWTELGGQASGENSLAGEFGQDSDTKSNPGELEEVSEDVQVSCSKDEDNDRSVCKSGSSWVVPGEQGGEEGVVMCEGLSGGSVSIGRSSGSSKVGEFTLCAVSLILDAGSNWAYTNEQLVVHRK